MIENFHLNQLINSETKVSVHLITCNQENYILQAVEGVLKQKVNFKYELIIGDDCSTDNTRSILLEYKQRYPQIIELLLHPHNLGPKGLEGKNNFLVTYNHCKGKYIAFCEGDDYWTDPNKLQKQVDFLEANPDYSICFHAANTLSNGIEKPSLLNRSDKEETYSILDLAEMNIMHTPSVVFRNGLFDKFPEWFNESPAGDYVLHLLNAKKGLIKYFPQKMAVYRVHDAGAWAPHDMSIIYPKWLWVLDKLQHEDFDEAVLQKISDQKNRNFNEYIKLLLDTNQYNLIKESYHKFYKNDEAFDIGSLIDLFTKAMSNLDNEIDGIKNTKVYKTGKRLSSFKQKYSTLLSKNKKTT